MASLLTKLEHNFDVTKLHHYQFASQFIVKPGTFIARLTGGVTFEVKSYFRNTQLSVLLYIYAHTHAAHHGFWPPCGGVWEGNTFTLRCSPANLETTLLQRIELEYKAQRCRKDFLIGGAQCETTHRVVSNLYNNL